MDRAALVNLIETAIGPDRPARLGIAVSGGGDSMALMQGLAALDGFKALMVATVDHGLRPESAAEAEEVARATQALDLPHETLHWRGWDGQGNLQDAARRARYDLLADWARRHGLEAVALGHTADDIAETFLMRLARRAGVDGLAAMQARRLDRGVIWLRPLLAARREDLRAYLRGEGQAWVDDPSNDSDAFDRIKARRALGELSPLGLGVEDIVAVAANLADVRRFLAAQTAEAGLKVVRQEDGDLLFDRARFAALDDEIARRLLSLALQWLAGTDYGPRRAALDRAQAALVRGQEMTLHGCILVPQRGRVWLCRELAAVPPRGGAQPWDGRWTLPGAARGLSIGPLGPEGLQACPDWRKTGRPRASLLAAPGVWRGDRLVSAPAAGFGAKPAPRLISARAGFHDFLLSR